MRLRLEPHSWLRRHSSSWLAATQAGHESQIKSRRARLQAVIHPDTAAMAANARKRNVSAQREGEYPARSERAPTLVPCGRRANPYNLPASFRMIPWSWDSCAVPRCNCPGGGLTCFSADLNTRERRLGGPHLLVGRMPCKHGGRGIRLPTLEDCSLVTRGTPPNAVSSSRDKPGHALARASTEDRR